MKNNIATFFIKEKCCGCTACMSICGKYAIQMQYDSHGFLYPIVDESLCINCGKCVGLCPDDNIIAINPKIVIACRHSEEKEQISSASGGFATALSQTIINSGGIVYGVAYDVFPHVATIRVENKEDIEKLKGSKYVQSDLKKVFCEICKDLVDNKQVAFFGTSCHVNGLLNYLATKHVPMDNLVTIDFICHGVPSPILFEEYIAFLSKNKKKVANFQFRTKNGELGWGYGSKSFYPTINWTNGKSETNTLKSLAWQNLFFSNNCLRPNCYHCPYPGVGRSGDYTIADYWGLMEVHPEFFSNKGVSLVFCNTDKAKNKFSSINHLVSIESSYEKAEIKQGNLHKPSIVGPDAEKFWSHYQTCGIQGVLEKYAGLNFLTEIKWYLKKIKR